MEVAEKKMEIFLASFAALREIFAHALETGANVAVRILCALRWVGLLRVLIGSTSLTHN